MRIWTTVKLVFLLAILIVLGLLFDMNKHLLMQDFRLFAGHGMPVLLVIALAFALGIMVSVVMLGLREVENLLGRFRERRNAEERSRADALTYSGVDALMENRLSDAKRLLGEALRIQPMHERAGIRYGQVLRLEGNAEEALRRHRAVLERHADSWEAHIETARDLAALRRHREAADLVRQAVKKHPARAAEAQPILLDIYMGAGDWDRAQATYEEIKKRAARENMPDPCAECEYVLPYRRALAFAEAENFKPAEKILRKLVKAHPKFVPAHVALGRVLIEAGLEDDGVAAWLDGMRKTGALTFLPMLEEYFIEMERPDKALETFRTIAAEAHNDILPRFLLGKLYYRLEMVDEAHEQFRAIEARVPKSATLHYFLGKARERRGALREAVESYKRAIRESGALALQYVCRACGAACEKWSDRCVRCGVWGQIEMDFRTELLPRDLGLVDAPVYAAG